MSNNDLVLLGGLGLLAYLLSRTNAQATGSTGTPSGSYSYQTITIPGTYYTPGYQQPAYVPPANQANNASAAVPIVVPPEQMQYAPNNPSGYVKRPPPPKIPILPAPLIPSPESTASPPGSKQSPYVTVTQPPADSPLVPDYIQVTQPPTYSPLIPDYVTVTPNQGPTYSVSASESGYAIDPNSLPPDYVTVTPPPNYSPVNSSVTTYENYVPVTAPPPSSPIYTPPTPSDVPAYVTITPVPVASPSYIPEPVYVTPPPPPDYVTVTPPYVPPPVQYVAPPAPYVPPPTAPYVPPYVPPPVQYVAPPAPYVPPPTAPYVPPPVQYVAPSAAPYVPPAPYVASSVPYQTPYVPPAPAPYVPWWQANQPITPYNSYVNPNSNWYSSTAYDIPQWQGYSGSQYSSPNPEAWSVPGAYGRNS